ncbi:MAG: hypothetical protein JO055_13940 [Alphaproteobacteria bacterium]|nr:hypothetical protein [Alphaproteobacteria bacterium]
MLQPMASNAETASNRAGEFWRGQQKVLDSMQAFAGGWFDRRQTGTRAALEAAQRICTAKTPVDAVREYQEWASGSLQRMADDSVALQRQVMEITEALIAAPAVPMPTVAPPVGVTPAPNAQQQAAE